MGAGADGVADLAAETQHVRRGIRHALLLCALLAATLPRVAHASGWSVDWSTYTYTSYDTHAAMDMHSSLAACIVTYEVGGVGYDPYAVGAAGEMGAAQLHPQGLYGDFLAQGYTDPYSPYQALDYLDDALDRGLGWNWTTYALCT